MTGEHFLMNLNMSDEFLRVATNEINEEIKEISKILQSCKNDSDVSKNGTEIEKHFHKIKGLAPMMGKKKVGKIAELIDAVLKHVLEGNTPKNIYSIMILSTQFMESDMQDSSTEYEKLKEKIENEFSNFIS